MPKLLPAGLIQTVKQLEKSALYLLFYKFMTLYLICFVILYSNFILFEFIDFYGTILTYLTI